MTDDLHEARQIIPPLMQVRDDPWARRVAAGGLDDCQEMRIARAALARGRELEREESGGVYKHKVFYALGLLVEEMGEALCHIGRALRFGLDTRGDDGLTERDGLNKELGDVGAAINYAVECKVLDNRKIFTRTSAKIRKLLNPKSTDNKGRRLAPDPDS